MASVLWVLGAWLLFGGAHVGLATGRTRASLVRRLGEQGFASLFVAVSSVLFVVLTAAYAGVSASGPAGLGLAGLAWTRTLLVTLVILGFAFMAGALAPRGYWDSPVAVLRDGVRPAQGLERVTRHPFFTGLFLVMGAHALLATRLTGTIFFAGFVALIVLGASHQARKLRARKGEPFARYLESTSAVPFAAIVRGRQPWAPRELPWVALGVGALVGWGVWAGHAWLLAGRGAVFSLSVVAGSLVIGAITARRQRRPMEFLR
jgi:uncharacterized membrane protein